MLHVWSKEEERGTLISALLLAALIIQSAATPTATSTAHKAQRVHEPIAEAARAAVVNKALVETRSGEYG